MHPENIYKDGVSFEQLGNDCPAFKKYLKGRSTVEFHDPAAVRELAKSLLSRDFKLDVELPDDRLCPMVPNRLNYILWLRDLLLDTQGNELALNVPATNEIIGLDIGTGASAIYPLLACASFKHWKMIGSDIDDKSLACASRNIDKNGLSERISIQRAGSGSTDKILDLDKWGVQRLDFTMCNPPFYFSVDDLLSSAKLKSLPPLSACTGTTTEMVTSGGESAFVDRMIVESLLLRDRIRWYTSMLGKLSSVETVVKSLEERGISNYVVGEFVQGAGKTKRWVVGWSFGDRIAGDHIGRQPISASLKAHLPFPTTFRIDVPVIGSLHDVLAAARFAVDSAIHSLPLSFKWSDTPFPSFATMHHAGELFANGAGLSNGNVWSRAARRQMERQKREEINNTATKKDSAVFGFDILLLFGEMLSTHIEFAPSPSESSRLEEEDIGVEDVDLSIQAAQQGKRGIGQKNPFVLIRWTRGLDRVIWESFCGMLRRKLLDDLSKKR